MQKLGISLALAALFTLLVATLALVTLLVRALEHLRRARLSALAPGAFVRILTPDREIFHGRLLEREDLHLWVAIEPGDARLRVPVNWVSVARRRAPRRSRGGESESPP